MSWEQPGRARRILIEREHGTHEAYIRGKGDEDDLWYPHVPQPGAPIRSPVLL
jgi:hypothetical protein